ncbi:MAG: hypothetical protein NZ521_10800 [Flammeovirgaceae bacterium]|nr:hypothetical protein [Flammeovirgaceae bacterium]MDW8288700.1 hypothetical protein [Flammeovirgaceae bacterium]
MKHQSVFRQLLLLVCFFFSFSGTMWAQFQDDASESMYQTELVFGINFNTNGGLIGGGMIKYAQRLKSHPNQYHSFALELVNIKHPKEQISVSPFTGTSFIYGKTNYLFIMRPQYGRELILFKKAREQGIQVNFISAAGISLGIASPYTIRYDDPRDPNDNPTEYVQFNPQIHKNPNYIRDTGGPFKGLNTAKIYPGLNLKASFSFEFGVIKSNVSGFEAGWNLDMFSQKIMMFNIVKPEGRSYYSSIFLTFFFGGRR